MGIVFQGTELGGGQVDVAFLVLVGERCRPELRELGEARVSWREPGWAAEFRAISRPFP
jgi:hypothetical protein